MLTEGFFGEPVKKFFVEVPEKDADRAINIVKKSNITGPSVGVVRSPESKLPGCARFMVDLRYDGEAFVLRDLSKADLLRLYEYEIDNGLAYSPASKVETI